MERPEPKFKVGDIVAAKAFTDCFKKYHERVEMLKVAEMRLIEANLPSRFALPPYWRCKAVGPDGWQYIEAHEDHFEKVSELGKEQT